MNEEWKFSKSEKFNVTNKEVKFIPKFVKRVEQMEPITTVLLSVGLASDAFAVSLSSGLAIRRMKINKALKIALFFGIFKPWCL